MNDSEFRVYAQSQGAHFGFELTEANINLYGADATLVSVNKAVWANE